MVNSVGHDQMPQNAKAYLSQYLALLWYLKQKIKDQLVGKFQNHFTEVQLLLYIGIFQHWNQQMKNADFFVIYQLYFSNMYMGHAIRKCVLAPIWTVKAQIRLRICTVWSGPSLSANRIIGPKNVLMESKCLNET